MINFNANINSVLGSPYGVAPNTKIPLPQAETAAAENTDFTKTIEAVGKHISKVDDLQQSSDMSIADLLAGKNMDITSVVSEVAKADMSFKLLVGVRNKLIEAYKQTMNMPL